MFFTDLITKLHKIPVNVLAEVKVNGEDIISVEFKSPNLIEIYTGDIKGAEDAKKEGLSDLSE